MKALLVFLILILIQSVSLAKLIIADTIGQEKIVRNLAFNLNPARNIEIKSAKLADALRALRQGKINLLLSSHKLDRKQRTQLKINCYRYALDPLLFVVNSGDKIKSLSKKQLQDVLKGDILTWRPLGGEAYSINLGIVKDGQPGIYTLHKKFLKKSGIKAKYLEVTNAKGIGVLASMKKGFLGICGYINLPLAAKPLAVDGISPTVANIRAGSYKPVTEYWVWTSDKKEHKKSLDYKATLEFIKLLRDKKTIKFIESCGFLSNAK
jgi:phosphate transport system substrate-binding protein